MSLQKCKSLKTAAAGKYFCIALVGKGSRTPPPPPNPQTLPSVYSHIFRPKVRDHQPLPQPRELAQKAACSLTNPDVAKSVGLHFCPKGPERSQHCAVSGCSMAGRLCPGPGFGHLWSGAREASGPVIQHCLSLWSAGEQGEPPGTPEGRVPPCSALCKPQHPAAPAGPGG